MGVLGPWSGLSRTSARLIIAFALHVILTGAFADISVHVTIPFAVRTQDTVTLQCEYDLKGEPLYTLKWYKGQKEFFRYIPKELPNIQVFPLTGINVDLSRSNKNKVVLYDVKPEVTGKYRCEVSSDAPNFYTLVESRFMYVVDIPLEGPSLKVEKEVLEVGATLRGNCSSPPTYPPANITWLLNGKEINNSSVRRQTNITSVSKNRRAPVVMESSMELEIDGNTFKAGKAKLVCLASVFDLYQKEKEIILLEERPRPRPSLVMGSREAKSGSSKCDPFYTLVSRLIMWALKR